MTDLRNSLGLSYDDIQLANYFKITDWQRFVAQIRPVLCSHQWTYWWHRTYGPKLSAGIMMTEFWFHILVRPARIVHGLFPQVMQRLHLCQYHGYRHLCLMPQHCLLLTRVDQYTWLMGRCCWVEISISCANVETANGIKWDGILFVMNQQPCNCSHIHSINRKYFSSNIKDTALLIKQTMLTTQDIPYYFQP